MSTTNSLTQYNATVVTGRTYYFKLRTVNSVGSSALTVQSSGMVAGSVPSQPFNLTIVT